MSSNSNSTNASGYESDSVVVKKNLNIIAKNQVVLNNSLNLQLMLQF